MARRIGDALWRRRIGGRLGGGKVTTGGIDWLLKLDYPVDADISDTYTENGFTITLVETDGNLTISSGAMQISAQSTPTWGHLGYYGAAQTRAAGLLLLAKINVTTWEECGFGWHTAAAVVDPDSMEAAIQLHATDGRLDNQAAKSIITGLSTATDYYLFSILRSTGAFLGIHNGSNWIVLDVLDSGSTATLYAVMSNLDGVIVHDTARITQLPTANAACFPAPLVSDDGSGAAGAIGSSNGLVDPSYTDAGAPVGAGYAFSNAGATWTRDGAGALVNTPTPGAELVTNGGSPFAFTGDNPNSWPVVGESAPNLEISEVGTGEGHGGVGTGYLNIYRNAAGNIYCYQTNNNFTGKWLMVTVVIDTINSGTLRAFVGSFGGDYVSATTAGTHQGTQLQDNNVIVLYANANPTDVTIESISIKPLVLAELMTLIDRSVSTCILRAPLTITGNYQAGLVARADSASNPQSYILVYLDRTDSKIYAIKSVAGVVTQLGATAVTVSAGAKIVLRVLSDNTAWIGYNDAFVASYTVSDAAIISNTLHGPFSTGPGSSISSYEFFPPHAIDLDAYTP